MYHTFLHHSQTTRCMILLFFELVYHTFLHHSQTMSISASALSQLVYHTFLHHSQTSYHPVTLVTCLCTIHFYIILKLIRTVNGNKSACVPYIFTSFSNILFSVSFTASACVPYIFTSFSNLKFKNEMPSPA